LVQVPARGEGEQHLRDRRSVEQGDLSVTVTRRMIFGTKLRERVA
jgi:hypothetical protein